MENTAENKESVEEINQVAAAEWFRNRVSELKALLPKNYKMPLIALLPKAYDSYKGGVIITNVLNGNSSDMAVLEAMEKLVKSL